MPALSEHVNVYTTAIAVLEHKGFSVWYDRKQDAYCAQRDGWDFWAENPVSLLGLAAIFEYKKPSEYTSRCGRLRVPFDIRMFLRLRPNIPPSMVGNDATVTANKG